MSARVGLGVDFHRLGEGRPLVLGGVTIPHPRGLLGHSDGDVLLHALCDALLGAAGRGDIGTHFPDSDPSTLQISSVVLLRRVAQELTHLGWRAVNVDCVVVAEEPRIAPFLEAMRAAICPVLKLEPGDVGLKATTSETMGSLGRREGIAALAVALIRRA